MAWERRGNKMYYYRSVKVGRRVRKIYFGTGPEAELAALAAGRRRGVRERRAAKLQQQREFCRLVDATLDQFEAVLDELARGVLVAAGCRAR